MNRRTFTTLAVLLVLAYAVHTLRAAKNTGTRLANNHAAIAAALEE